jgi:GAF domain-containing protein
MPTMKHFAVDDIYQAGHADCHIQLLEQFEAKAYAIVPLFQGEKLWGLLAAYQNSQPRHWQDDEIDLLNQIGAQLTLALKQLDYLNKCRHNQQNCPSCRTGKNARTPEKLGGDCG